MQETTLSPQTLGMYLNCLRRMRQALWEDRDEMPFMDNQALVDWAARFDDDILLRQRQFGRGGLEWLRGQVARPYWGLTEVQ
jgi:hypothetical protein